MFDAFLDVTLVGFQPILRTALGSLETGLSVAWQRAQLTKQLFVDLLGLARQVWLPGLEVLLDKVNVASDPGENGGGLGADDWVFSLDSGGADDPGRDTDDLPCCLVEEGAAAVVLANALSCGAGTHDCVPVAQARGLLAAFRA